MKRIARSLKIHPDKVADVQQRFSRSAYKNQAEFAKDGGVSKDTAGKFLKGGQVDRSNFIDLCEALGLETDEINEISIPGDKAFGVDDPPQNKLKELNDIPHSKDAEDNLGSAAENFSSAEEESDNSHRESLSASQSNIDQPDHNVNVRQNIVHNHPGGIVVGIVNGDLNL